MSQPPEKTSSTATAELRCAALTGIFSLTLTINILHDIVYVQKVSLNMIEAMYKEKTRRFAWEPHKNGLLQLLHSKQ